MKKLDKLENEFLPQVMVDTTEVIFDKIYFLESQSKDLIIANTGQVWLQSYALLRNVSSVREHKWRLFRFRFLCSLNLSKN